MVRNNSISRFIVLTLGILVLFAFTTRVEASHTWGGYHWARTANPFTIKLGDNVSTVWDGYLATTSADWSLSSTLDTVIVPGRGGKNCRASAGRAEVCNSKYGRNGWLGIATIWASGSHITQGTVKLNDTYFNTVAYNTSAWRNLVMCQEVGHIFGLDHQDENFTNANLGTCMDYTNSPESNQHPNAHDYEMLETIYAHIDSSTTISQVASSVAPAEDSNDQKAWGKEIRRSKDGRASLFVAELGNGQRIIRHVFWAEPRGNRDH